MTATSDRSGRTRHFGCPSCGAEVRKSANPYFGVGLALHQHVWRCTKCDWTDFVQLTGRHGAKARVWGRPQAPSGATPCPSCGSPTRTTRNPYFGVGLATHESVRSCTECDWSVLIAPAAELAGEPESCAAERGGTHPSWWESMWSRGSQPPSPSFLARRGTEIYDGPVPASTPRPPRRDARQTRTSIIAAAALVLQVDPEAGLDRIAREAGISRRTIYGHFASRDDLLGEVLTVGAARIVQSLFPLDDSDPRLAIATIGSRLWREVSHMRTVAQLAVRGPHRVRIAEVLRPLREVIERTVRTGMRAGVFRQDVDPAVLARLVEAAALAVLDEATRTGMSAEEGNRLVIVSTLSSTGLGWEEAAAYVDKVTA